MEAPFGFVGDVAFGMPEDVAVFVERNNLHSAVDAALRLVQRCFNLAEPPCLEMLLDPESAEEWVLVRVVVRATPEETLAAYRDYARAFVQATPMPQRDMISVSYRVLPP